MPINLFRFQRTKPMTAVSTQTDFEEAFSKDALKSKISKFLAQVEARLIINQPKIQENINLPDIPHPKIHFSELISIDQKQND